MTKYDQLGPIVSLNFDSSGYDTIHQNTDGTYYDLFGAEAEVDEDHEVITIEPFPSSNIGHVALFGAYLFHTKKVGIAIKLPSEVSLELKYEPRMERRRLLPYVSESEVNSRFDVITTDVELDDDIRILIADTALKLVVQYNKLPAEARAGHLEIY